MHLFPTWHQDFCFPVQKTMQYLMSEKELFAALIE